MIEKKIAVCIGTDRAKHVRARLSLMLVDGDTVLSEHYHSVGLVPGADLAALRELVEAHIARPDGVPGAPWPKIPDAEWQEVVDCVAAVQKPAVVQAYRARAAAEEAIREAQRKKQSA
jgi:hypothetical protein